MQSNLKLSRCPRQRRSSSLRASKGGQVSEQPTARAVNLLSPVGYFWLRKIADLSKVVIVPNVVSAQFEAGIKAQRDKDHRSDSSKGVSGTLTQLDRAHHAPAP